MRKGYAEAATALPISLRGGNILNMKGGDIMNYYEYIFAITIIALMLYIIKK